MWSSRNFDRHALRAALILDHWDMWSSRNARCINDSGPAILDHWDMWSSRNFADISELDRTYFRSLGYVV